ncbi:protein kinase, ATP binding site-containing protein [Tanacetum coccineum]
MAVAKNDINRYNESSFKLCNCYKVESLTETILETDQISDLKDRYVLGDQLGWGQFGIIRECSDKLTGEVLACKSISKNRLVTDEDVKSVKLEIEIMTRLSGHPNVVDLKAVYEEEGYVHLVMELCAGGELFHKLEKQGRFSESEARVLFKHLMQVVRFCHDKGVVHRDLKPENILLATKASSSQIKLADFGLATYITPGQSLHGTVGSPFYIAPEVLAGGYNQAADVWSAGVILYILLSGKPPFWGKTKSRIFDAVRAASLRFQSDPWNGISDSAKELIRGMLHTDPSIRLTAQQVLDHVWTDGTHSLPLEFEITESPSSSLFMARTDDISFGMGTGSPIICETFSCKSSFSSFLVEPVTPFVNSCGFSFRSSGGSSNATLDFCTPIHTISSFTFFSPGPETENEPSVCLLDQETKEGKEQKLSEVKRGSGSRKSSMHNKRNRTIGLGEFEQLDLVVAESVIRSSLLFGPYSVSRIISKAWSQHLISASG